LPPVTEAEALGGKVSNILSGMSIAGITGMGILTGKILTCVPDLALMQVAVMTAYSHFF
jgi:hypothetical protein